MRGNETIGDAGNGFKLASEHVNVIAASPVRGHHAMLAIERVGCCADADSGEGEDPMLISENSISLQRQYTISADSPVIIPNVLDSRRCAALFAPDGTPVSCSNVPRG